jgi:ribonucleoside-diphosphate reductase alpha chain
MARKPSTTNTTRRDYRMSLPTQYQDFIALSRYARGLPPVERREAWEETVRRYCDYWVAKGYITQAEADELFEYIVSLGVMPSMRALMTAGIALDRDNVAGFNCSYSAIEGGGETLKVMTEEMAEAGFTAPVLIHLSAPVDFDEIMYVLLCGTGVGFSVERQFTNQLPTVGHKLTRKTYARTEESFPGVDKDDLSTFSRKTNTIYVADSKYGWASALRIMVVELYNGNFDIQWDVSKVRPKGAPLKTFGGRASGPEPLVELFEFMVPLFREAEGRRLNSVECHDLVCKIADIVVVGGVRRSALISLSNLSDQRMAKAKSGNWYDTEPQRQLANNSIAFTETPDVGSWMQEWLNIYQSFSGERGTFSRPAAQRTAARNGRRDPNQDFGTNPCSEIILRSKQFCNLSEVVVRPEDDYGTLRDKIRIATILGTLQATLTDFKYLRPIWKKNTEEEALLGVSLTGIMDNQYLNGGPNTFKAKDLEELRDYAVQINKKWAKRLGINQSAAITCVKPSGTVSQLCDSASGIHARHAPYYIRTVRADAKDPLTKLMQAEGFPWEWAIGKEGNTVVFSFPMKAPEDAVFRDDRTALEQLDHWLLFARHWCEHKPSVTINVKDHEWPDVGAWVWKHFDEVSGVSFLPHDGGIYPQAPYQDCTKEEYEIALAQMPQNVDWSKLGEYEKEDHTKSSQTMACSGGSCEVVDL